MYAKGYFAVIDFVFLLLKVIKLKNNVVPFSTPLPAPKKLQPKKQEQPPMNNAQTAAEGALM